MRIRSWAVYKFVLLVLAVILFHGLSYLTAIAQDKSKYQSASFNEVQETVSRLLANPVYTTADERFLNTAGDLAALAIAKTVTTQEINSPETGRRILLILHLAFEAPQSIRGRNNKSATVALRMLDQLERTDYGRQPNVVANARFEIKHASTTGQPLRYVGLPGEPAIDWEHAQWVSSVMAWIATIKPGMTRKELLQVFTTEGGLSTRTQRTYVLSQCRTIKVDVEFSAAGKENDMQEMPEDKIVKISKPYLEYSILD